VLERRQQLANDSVVTGYEIVQDDGSTDGTLTWLQEAANFPMCECSHKPSRTSCRPKFGCGVFGRGHDHFIDSDLVVTPNFLQAHAQSLVLLDLGRTCPTYGQVINTCNFDNPTSDTS